MRPPLNTHTKETQASLQCRGECVLLDGMLIHPNVTPSPALPSTCDYLYTWVESVLSKNTTDCLQPGLEPGLLDLESRARKARAKQP